MLTSPGCTLGADSRKRGAGKRREVGDKGAGGDFGTMLGPSRGP